MEKLTNEVLVTTTTIQMHNYTTTHYTLTYIIPDTDLNATGQLFVYIK